MKFKILTALKIKYKNLGFSDKAFEGVADFLSTSTTEEDQIETAIAGVEPMFKAFQGDADNRVNSAVEKAKAKKAEEEEKGGEDPTKKKTAKTEEEPPAWAKSMIESNQALQAKIEAIESGKATESRQKQLETKLEGVHESIKETALKNFKYAKFDTDEEFEAYLEDVVPSVETANQAFEESGLGATKPIFGTTDSKTGVSSSVQNFIEARKNNTGGELAGKEI